MQEIFEVTNRPSDALFFRNHDRQDVRLGELVSSEIDHYGNSDVVIVGCPDDGGIVRAGGPALASSAPDAIREHFYRLSNFGIHRKIFDLGNIVTDGNLERTHERLRIVSDTVLRDGKRLIVLGGGGDIAYPNGVAMSEIFGRDRWLAINVDARLDIAEKSEITSETPFRKLLEADLILPSYLYEIAFQTQDVSPVHYRHLVEIGSKLISLEMLRSRNAADTELRETIRQEFIHHSRTMNVFFCFDLQAVRASEAPGVTRPSPFGLRAGEFLKLVEFAADLVNTKLIAFAEVNPGSDQNGQTAKLVAIAMHRICSAKL